MMVLRHSNLIFYRIFTPGFFKQKMSFDTDFVKTLFLIELYSVLLF